MHSVDALLQYMQQHDLDAFFLAKKPNVRYISGYTGDDSYLLITKDRFFFLTDPRYTEQVAQECPDYEIVLWKNYGSIGECVADLAQQQHLQSIGFEADALSYLFYSQLEKNVKAQLVATTDVVETFRSIKTPQEIEYLRAACEISCRAFAFHSLDLAISAAKAAGGYQGCSILYKKPGSREYVLLVESRDASQEDFARVCNTAAEYGRKLEITPATLAYYEEHYDIIIGTDAIQKLSRI